MQSNSHFLIIFTLPELLIDFFPGSIQWFTEIVGPETADQLPSD